jgi:hypothetical protein
MYCLLMVFCHQLLVHKLVDQRKCAFETEVSCNPRIHLLFVLSAVQVVTTKELANVGSVVNASKDINNSKQLNFK